MRKEAERHKINVASPYPTAMKWSISNRSDTVGAFVAQRRREATQTMELTSLGHAYLAAAPEWRRNELLAQFHERRAKGWSTLLREITTAIEDIRQLGYYWGSWQPEVVAVATPIVVADSSIYMLNMSVSETTTPKQFVASFHRPLLDLADRIPRAIEMS